MKAAVEGVRWSADADGQWLHIKCSRPQQIIGDMKLDKKYDFEITEHRKKRSLDANALYWVLLTSLAKTLGISNPAAHNMMLRRYGCTETFGDKIAYLVLPDTADAEQKALEAESFHIKPTSQTRKGKDGLMYRTYILLRGSSTYDTTEMSRLIDGLISECKDLGIDHITRYEAALIADWEARHEKPVRSPA